MESTFQSYRKTSRIVFPKPGTGHLQPRAILLRRTASGRESIARHAIDTERRRRNPEGRVLLEEVRGTEHNADRLGRHDGEVLRAREVSQPELHVADDIRVLDVLVPVGPVNNGLVVRVVLFTGRLADVVTGGEEFVVLVGDDPERVSGKGGALPDDTAGFGEEAGAAVVDDLVGDGLLRDVVHFVRVDDVPGAAGFVAVVVDAFERGAERSLFAVEGVSVGVLGRAHWVF